MPLERQGVRHDQRCNRYHVVHSVVLPVVPDIEKNRIQREDLQYLHRKDQLRREYDDRNDSEFKTSPLCDHFTTSLKDHHECDPYGSNTCGAVTEQSQKLHRFDVARRTTSQPQSSIFIQDTIDQAHKAYPKNRD